MRKGDATAMWRGRDVQDMTKEELIAALFELSRMLDAQQKESMSALGLFSRGKPPTHDLV